MENTKAFPLAWPIGKARTTNRRHPSFSEKTLARVFTLLRDELRRLGALYVVISTNVPLKQNGESYSDPGKMADPGVAVYFRYKGVNYCLPCDRWILVEDNMYAVSKHIEAMRGMERWGVQSVEQAFSGFKALTAETEGEAWWTVLECSPTATRAQIEHAFRTKLRQVHPDAGGSNDAMSKLNIARDQALSTVKELTNAV